MVFICVLRVDNTYDMMDKSVEAADRSMGETETLAAKVMGLINQLGGDLKAKRTRVLRLAWDAPVGAVFTLVYRYTGSPNFGRSVLGCTEADFCN